MVREDCELARFQQMAEMLHGLIDSQQFAIVGAVFLLGWVQLPGKESEGLPSVVDKLLHGPIA
jgi:hypothetical protein